MPLTALSARLTRPYIWPLLVLILANILISAAGSPGLRYPAALVLLAFLPGWTWLEAGFSQDLDLAERLILAVGLSLAFTIFGVMAAVYLPGPLTAAQILITINTISIAGIIAIWRQRPPAAPVRKQFGAPAIVVLGLLLLLAAALRLPRLGYAEFHEDEAEALMLGVRLLQGEDYALFLHRKGPAQMLLPVAFWLLAGRITETLARFPFALSSILSVVALFLIGRRWFNWQAGAVAGLLWAINGYAIGFGRMVQYQALIFFLGPLAIYCLYLAWTSGQLRWQIPGATLLAACLLAHFDALLLLPAAGYLALLPHLSSPRSRYGLITTTAATLLFIVLLASFYAPYILDPEFQNTMTYLAETRVRPGLLYNNLDILRRFDRDYSSRFYLPLLAAGLISVVGWQSAHLAGKWRLVLAGLLLLAASTFWLPHLWGGEWISLALLPWLLLGWLCFQFASGPELRAAWILCGAAALGYLFLVDDPRTHLYMIYPGAVLLAGAGWAALMRQRAARVIAPAGGLALAGAVLVYLPAIFLQTESGFIQLRRQWDESAWETIYDDIPQVREYFGYPKREGWKAIGALRAQGLFPGDFRSVNEDFIVPIWYNYGQARSCYDTPAQFFVRLQGMEDYVLPANESYNGAYHETGLISREQEIRLKIFSAGAAPTSEPAIYPVEMLEATFDQLATPQKFAQQAAPSRPVGAQFGRAINFTGYDLPSGTVAPGDILRVNLYWQALASPEVNYRAFVHLTDGDRLWGQQDDDPACRLPTSIWRSGQRGVGQFRLQIDPETPPGRYPLIIGLYQTGTLDRLEISAGAGQVGDDFLWLGDVEVVD